MFSDTGIINIFFFWVAGEHSEPPTGGVTGTDGCQRVSGARYAHDRCANKHELPIMAVGTAAVVMMPPRACPVLAS